MPIGLLTLLASILLIHLLAVTCTQLEGKRTHMNPQNNALYSETNKFHFRCEQHLLPSGCL